MLSRIRMYKWLPIFVMVVLVLCTVVPVVSAMSQTWYFTSNAKPSGAPMANDGLTHAKDNLIHKGERVGTGSYFDLSSDEVAWFYADAGAETDLSFGENTWKAYIRTEAIEDDEVGHNLTVDICKVANDGSVTILASHSEVLVGAISKTLWEIPCEDEEGTTQDFNTGDWLAIRLSWDCPTDALRIWYKAEEGSDSYIESPASDPGYPNSEISIPEFTTIAIPAAMVLGLAFLMQRRKK